MYIYGDNSKNIDVLNKIKGHKTICLKNTGHFAHLKKAIISRLILTELKKERHKLKEKKIYPVDMYV